MTDQSKSGFTEEQKIDRVHQRALFNNWFLNLLSIQSTCLERDVLRDSKEQLFEAWMVRKPWVG